MSGINSGSTSSPAEHEAVMEIVLIIVAVIVLFSLQCHLDEEQIRQDYERWKNRR
jgi:hypothetical protein